MNKEKRQLLDKTFQTFMNVGLGGENLDLIHDIVAKDVVGFGTTIDEKIFGVKQLQELLERQKIQSAGMHLSWKITTLDIHISADENTAILTNEVTFYFTVESDTMEMYIRFSVVLEYVQNKWIIVHWHGSKPEHVESEKDTWGIETWKEKAEALEKEVAERTADLLEKNSELQVEAALERVRAISLAMHHTSELQSVIHTVHKELLKLNLSISGGSFIVINNKIDTELHCWGSGGTADTSDEVYIPYFDKPFYTHLLNGIKSGPGLFTEEYSRDEKIEFFTFLFQHKPWSKLGAKDKKETLSAPGGYTRSCAVSKHTSIIIINHFGEKFSEAENAILKRFAKVFEQAYTRFLDLQKAEAQAKEAQIELALERVRAKAMAMQGPAHFEEVIKVMGEQFIHLDFDIEWVNFGANGLDVSNGIDTWNFAVIPGGNPISSRFFIPYLDHSLFLEAVEHLDNYRRTGYDFFEMSCGKEEKDRWLDHLYANTIFKNIPEEFKAIQYAKPGYTSSNIALKDTWLSIGKFDKRSFTDEQHAILRRFGNAFGQAHTRFLDLQKAEAQAKEAQIEAALEKVRSRTMAMQKSEELADASQVLDQQVRSLGIETWGCAFHIYADNEEGDYEWFSSANGNLPFYKTPREKFFLKFYEKGQKGEKFHVEEFAGENCKAHYDFLKTLPVAGDALRALEASGIPLPTYQIDHIAFFPHGYILFITYQPVAEAQEVFQRFAKVFEQTYTRFLDLQKAEAQAREAKIETALEKVRSRTMGMQSSDELPEVANLLFTEVRALGIHAWSCGYNILADDKKTATAWMSSEGIMQTPFQLRLFGEASFDEMGEFVMSDHSLFVQELGGKAIEKHYDYMKTFPDLKPTFDHIDALGLSLPTYQINHLCKFNGGFILFITYEKVPESHDIFKRFTNVFDQTYTRFLDLKKAEAQAIEATKQSSLDRVRGEISTMRNADDLNRITPLVFNELTTLGIPFIRCGVFIVHEKENFVEIYLSTPKGKSLAMMNLPFDANEMSAKAVEAWKKEKVYIHHWNQTDFFNFGKSLQEQGHITNLQIYQGSEMPPESLHLHFVPFAQGLLYVGSPESLAEEQIDLVKALAKSFAIAYARYEDFVKLEKAKAEVESSMIELKATQSQLVHQEKLASLGQLTAGIAHEIKNPLNFVNNFSEVSVELIEEALEALATAQTRHVLSPGQALSSEHAFSQEQAMSPEHILSPGPGLSQNNENLEDIKDILTDIQSNLTKIHLHGTRANGIVSSMLQHSRGGSGKMEPTNLNALIREYVNLAFHGMRAGKNPINVEIKFNLDEKLGDVDLIGEDFSRVILNLANNGFDAMREKLKTEADFKPVLSISSWCNGKTVEISVADNGPGIPEDIKNKILQPFFTTKKGTEGTGLGLSITHDIIKAHGGELEVETSINKGSVFTIKLKK